MYTSDWRAATKDDVGLWARYVVNGVEAKFSQGRLEVVDGTWGTVTQQSPAGGPPRRDEYLLEHLQVRE